MEQKIVRQIKVSTFFYDELWEKFSNKRGEPEYTEKEMRRLLEHVDQAVSSEEKKMGNFFNRNTPKDSTQRIVDTLTAEKEKLERQVADFEAERNKLKAQCSASRKYAMLLLDDVQKRLDERLEEDWYFEGLKKLLKPLQNLLGYARALKELPEGSEISDYATECYFTDGVLKELKRTLGETIFRANANQTLDEKLECYMSEQARRTIVKSPPVQGELSLADLIKQIYEKNGTNARARRTTDSRCILHTLFPIMMELAQIDKENAISRLQEDALKIDFVLRSNGIFPFYIDSPELKENQEGQEKFGSDDVLKVAIPALFLKKSSEQNGYELLGDSYTGTYISKKQK